jgi:hypothetical protein
VWPDIDFVTKVSKHNRGRKEKIEAARRARRMSQERKTSEDTTGAASGDEGTERYAAQLAAGCMSSSAYDSDKFVRAMKHCPNPKICYREPLLIEIAPLVTRRSRTQLPDGDNLWIYGAMMANNCSRM